MSSSADAMAPSLPWAPNNGDPALGASTANAIDTHLADIAMTRNPTNKSQGTVLAFVTFPRDDKSNRACDGEPWSDTRLRMSYEKLMGLGSKKIRDMFNPRAQARFRRRLGIEQLPPGIEYVLDFTPPSEGPELADLTAALWLPRMVKLWFLAGQYIPSPVLETALGTQSRPLADKAVGAILALGHDDVCKNPGCLLDHTEWQAKEALPGIIDENPYAGLCHIPAWRKVEDYCPIRHRVAIIRLLRAINGEDLLLNSAVRLWTIAQVAISLEMPQVVVDPVTQWLVAPPNTKFIEICPERAFQLAYALKIPSVLIAAFKILVSELAIDYTSSTPTPGRPPLTWAQRRRDDYGDHPSDPVEYASRAFAERMHGKLRMLQADNVFDLLPVPVTQWERLQYYGSLIAALPPDTPLRIAYHNLTNGLVAAFREWVDRALHPDTSAKRLGNRLRELIEAQRRHYIPPADSMSLLALYGQLNLFQKVLTPFFWDELNWIGTRAEFAASQSHGQSLAIHNDNPSAPGPNLSALSKDLSAKGQSLSTHVAAFNTILYTALATRQILPDLSHPALSDIVYKDTFDPADWDIDLNTFYGSLRHAVNVLCDDLLQRNNSSRHRNADNYYNESGIPFFLSDHLLLTLDEKELNYLPIWADGLDDGSGGVFQDIIPNADMGPSEPGPGYHTGFTVASGAGTETDVDARTAVTGYAESRFAVSTTVGSDLGVGELGLGSDTGTVGRSLLAQESGASSATEGRSIGVGAGVVSVPSESFTADDESVYADARYAQPAAHQAQGQAIEEYVHEAEGSRGGIGGDGAMDLDFSDDEEMDFGSDDGSSTLDGFEEVDVKEAR